MVTEARRHDIGRALPTSRPWQPLQPNMESIYFVQWGGGDTMLDASMQEISKIYIYV